MDNSIKVYNKNMELLAIFSDYEEAISPDAKLDLMYAPMVHLESNSIPTFSFQMLANSPKWNDIKSPLNLYLVDGIWFTPLSDNSYVYTTEEGEVSVVNVTCLGIESLLAYQYHQIYNVNPYVYATRARFNRFVNGDAEFLIYSYNCTNPGNTISSANCWNAVKQWRRTDDNGNKISYAILTADEYKPTGWNDTPSGVFLKSLTVSGNTATMVVESRAKVKTGKVFEYNAGRTYRLDAKPIPPSIDEIKINSTVVTTSADKKTSTYTTSEKTTTNYSYNSSTGVVTLNYTPSSTEQINGITITYLNNDFGEISSNATCSFAAGAEAIDIHTVCVLPKSSTRNKLVIDNVIYEDSQVRDSRGVIMPRGSAGYAMWAVLRNTGWTLGICDVIAKGFDASIDYGVFNLETDMKDTLSNIRAINELYGGILVFDNAHKILHYRAENSTDYDSYNDGFNEWNGCVFREGKNLDEPPVVTYDNKIITRAYLLGYGNLNVAKVNNNKQYVENFSFTSDVYEGYLSQPLIYDTRDEGGQKQLLYWGKKELAKMCKPRKTVSLSVTDLRYLPEYSFEVFDVNSIAKVYYHDSQTGENIIEEQRVILREYNPFSLWDSTVELGDKTRNQVDIFKLIYKKANNMPGVNGDGNIPGSSVDMVPDTDPNSFPAYIQLIARTTTQNSDAIAGLILDTGADHARVDLFAQYQKKTDNLFAKTYAGLTFYADEKVSGALEYISGKWKTEKSDIEATYAKKVELTETSSTILETMNQKWIDERSSIDATYVKKVELTEESSRLIEIIDQKWKIKNENGTVVEIEGATGLLEEVNKAYTAKSDFTSYKQTVKTDIGNAVSASKTEILQYADDMIGAIQFNIASVKDDKTGESNGLRVTFGSHGITIENVKYDLTAFQDINIPLSDYIPETIINSANIAFRLDTQINYPGDRWTEPGLAVRLAEVIDDMDGWRYEGSTKIDGSKIMTGTVSATKLEGGVISLVGVDMWGYKVDVGFFTVQPASSYYGDKVDLTSGALSFYATDGDIFVSSGDEMHGISSHTAHLWANLGGQVYLEAPTIVATSAINEWSDKKVKKDIDYDMTEYLNMFDKIKPCSYKRTDGTSDRTHIGMVANDIEEMLHETGIGTQGFAGFVRDKDGNLMLRYTEFIGLCIAKIQQQDKELKELRAMIEGA